MIATGLVICAFAIFTMNNTRNIASAQASAAPAHVSNSFHFLVHAPLSSAAPLFGPDEERSWAGDEWDPQFLPICAHLVLQLPPLAVEWYGPTLSDSSRSIVIGVSEFPHGTRTGKRKWEMVT